jgi:hypothetical protein
MLVSWRNTFKQVQAQKMSVPHLRTIISKSDLPTLPIRFGGINSLWQDLSAMLLQFNGVTLANNFQVF